MPNVEWSPRDAAITFFIILLFLAGAIFTFRVNTITGVLLTFISAWFVFGFTYWTMQSGE